MLLKFKVIMLTFTILISAIDILDPNFNCFVIGYTQV